MTPHAFLEQATTLSLLQINNIRFVQLLFPRKEKTKEAIASNQILRCKNHILGTVQSICRSDLRSPPKIHKGATGRGGKDFCECVSPFIVLQELGTKQRKLSAEKKRKHIFFSFQSYFVSFCLFFFF